MARKAKEKEVVESKATDTGMVECTVQNKVIFANFGKIEIKDGKCKADEKRLKVLGDMGLLK